MIRYAPLLAVACAVDAYEPPSSVCPCDLDFSDHPRAEALQAVVDARVARGLPGLAVAVRTPEGVWAGAAGYANVEDGIPMNVCHTHHLASVAKTWYAVLALRLWERGDVDLDAKLSSYLSADVLDGVPNADVVTLRQLMNHTSGIPDFNADVSWVVGELNDPTREGTPLGLVDAVRGEAALGAPGEVYTYADTNYVLLALALEAVTGDPLQALRSEVFEALELQATTVYERGVAEPACLANSYWEVGGGRLENVSDLSAEYATQDLGADGVAASPLDALTFIEALARGDLLADDSLVQMTTFDPASERDDGYGYGLGLARTEPATGTLVGHTGGGVGVGAVVRASLDDEVTFVAATNAGMFLGGPLSEVFDETLWDDLASAAALQSQVDDPATSAR